MITNNTLDALMEHITFGTVAAGHNQPNVLKAHSVLGKSIETYNGLHDKKMAHAYWYLDGIAFGDTPAPKWVKHDMIINGGLPICMFVDQHYAPYDLVKALHAEDLDNIPIGFVDLHLCGDGKYSVSGLGIAPLYQGKGLSKYLLHAAAVISGMKQLIITTQLSNAQGHHAWLHLGPLELLQVQPLHDKSDTVVYAASIENPLTILKPASTGGYTSIVGFEALLAMPKEHIGKYVLEYGPKCLLFGDPKVQQ